MPAVALIGTLDTKGDEIAYVRERLQALRVEAVVIDSGILGEPGCAADIGREEVAAAGGHTLAGVQAAGSRGAAVSLMVDGVRALVVRLFAEGRVQGVLCLGGAEGALLGAAAMQALPVGVPKLLVSPSASGRRTFAAFVGESDVCVMHSVVDILGLNGISRPIFDNAAAAMAGMVHDAGSALGTFGEHCVGVTMLGQTTPGVMRLRDHLVRAGHEPVIFHANGVGGPAMEHLCEEGALQGVVDYTLSEVANSLKDGMHATGPGAADGRRPAGAPPGRRPRLRGLLQPGPARGAAAPVPRAQDLLPQPGDDARASGSRRGGRARRHRRRAPQRRHRARARRRAAARVLAGRRRGRRPVGPRGRLRLPRRAGRRRCAPTSRSNPSTPMSTTTTSPTWSPPVTSPSSELPYD